MIDPTGLQDLSDMVQLALMACDKPPKALAIELKCSISAVYQSLQGTRTLPASAMRKFAKPALPLHLVQWQCRLQDLKSCSNIVNLIGIFKQGLLN